MLTETLIALAAAGGTAVVEAAESDVWNTTKDHVGRLFGGDPEQVTALEARLEETHEQLASASPDQLDQVRERQTQVWATRLRDLLEEQPDTAPALQELLDELAKNPAMTDTATALGTRGAAAGGGVDSPAWPAGGGADSPP